MNTIQLTEQEARALDAFIAEHYTEWVNASETYLDEDERNDLESKLSCHD